MTIVDRTYVVSLKPRRLSILRVKLSSLSGTGIRYNAYNYTNRFNALGLEKTRSKSAKFANLLEIKTCLRHFQRAGGALMLNGAYFPNADGTFICAGGASPPMLRRPFP